MTATAEWIGRAIKRGAKRLALRLESSGEVLREWEGDELQTPEEIEQDAQFCAADEAKGKTGKAIYFRLCAFRTSKMGDSEVINANHSESHRFAQATDGNPEEVPESGHDLLVQVTRDLLRHTAEQNRTILQRDLALMGGHERMTKAAIDRAQFLEGKYMDVLQVIEKAASYEHERKVSEMETARKIDRDKLLARQIETYLPIGMRYLLGPKGKQAPIFQEELLRKFFGSLRPEQVEKLMSTFDEDQAAVIATLYMEFHGKAEEERIKNEEQAKAAETKDATKEGTAAE